MCEDHGSVLLTSRGKLIKSQENLDHQVYGLDVNVGVHHIQKGRCLSHYVEGLDVVWLISQVILNAKSIGIQVIKFDYIDLLSCGWAYICDINYVVFYYNFIGDDGVDGLPECHFLLVYLRLRLQNNVIFLYLNV